MDRFLALPRYPFKRAIIDNAPEESGLYGLFDRDEFLFLGKTGAMASIKSCLLWHLVGAGGECTSKATTYTWELSFSPEPRELEILARYVQAMGRKPRCQDSGLPSAG
jgi:hypothetical protein